MLRATSVQLRLTGSDLEGVLATYAAGRVESPAVELLDGAVAVRVRVAAEPLPMAVPVELRFTVRSVAGTRVELGVTWANLPLLPGALKEFALKKAFEALPGTYESGVLQLDVAEILEEIPVNFAIAEMDLNPHGVWVMLQDVTLYPLEVGALAEAQPGALVPVPAGEEAQLPEHQPYYKQLRERMKRFAVAKAPRWSQPLVPWLLAAPDFFVLLVRLARDERVPAMAKVIAGAAVAYFISPVDLIPDLIPLVGHIDDVALALFTVEQIASRLPPEVVQELWPGEGSVLDLVREGTQLMGRALPANVLLALKRILRK